MYLHYTKYSSKQSYKVGYYVHFTDEDLTKYQVSGKMKIQTGSVALEHTSLTGKQTLSS